MSLSHKLSRLPSFLAAIAVVAAVASADAADLYWKWGWGVYGLGVNRPAGALDNARFDWSFICGGNETINQPLVDRCNEILKINPNHKFVLRVWPTCGLGDCPENRYAATFLHYLYAPGVKDKLLDVVREQIGVIRHGISKPENFVGMIFLEELPEHFSTFAYLRDMQKGDPLPFDIKRFHKEIEAELGEPFDWSKEKHRTWWGKKWTQVMNEIHHTMKEASGGRTVLYYQMTSYSTLDHYDLDEAASKGDNSYVVPIHYADIVKPCLCDGIFGYPNNKAIWKQQTEAIVNKLHCLLMSQISTPPGMRNCRFDEMVNVARWKNPGNLGSFLYCHDGRKTRLANECSYMDDSFWTRVDHLRRIGWDHSVHTDIVDRELSPVVGMNYDLSGLRKGDFVYVQAFVWNRRHSSWYGGSVDRATLKDVRVSIHVPDGFSVPEWNNPEQPVMLGDLAPEDGRATAWYVRIEKNDATIPPGQSFRIVAATAEGAKGEAVSSAADQRVLPTQEHLIFRSGDRLMEPTYRLSNSKTVVELLPLGTTPILFPEINDGCRRVVYRDALQPGTRLVLGPSVKARLFCELFGENTRCFRLHGPGTDGAEAFDKGYRVYATPGVSVRGGERYKLSLTGWAKDGGNCLVIAQFTGRDASNPAKPASKDMAVFCNSFDDKSQTVQSDEVEVPRFDKDDACMVLSFYRFKQKGTVCYQSFDCRRADVPEQGLDVSSRLEGVLPDLVPPLTVWTYKDLSDPNLHGQPKLRLRFLQPEVMKSSEKKK